MTGEVINLRRERKRRARAASERAAQANRVDHGIPAAEREVSRAERNLVDRRLDGHALGPVPRQPEGEPPAR